MLLSFIISSSEFAHFPQQRTGFRGHVLAEVSVILKDILQSQRQLLLLAVCHFFDYEFSEAVFFSCLFVYF